MASAETLPAEYRVLARKYRPKTFAELIGQDALVRTLTNAISQNRIAHAFILTGVRGVGKTTTARIIARSLNCTGADGTGTATTEPCGVCPSCVSILEERNLDVFEMDAASHTSIDDIRTIIDGVHYKPTVSRYKIYIIDEVHMLSRSAFNALLKTLEEPPSHTKFIFATTEIRKLPITVQSRCQRFDLRRVSGELLAEHFSRITVLEGLEIESEAAGLIARAADGSVRDGLSLLDQAIARAFEFGGSTRAPMVTAESVKSMLGLADRGKIFDLFEATMRGEMALAIGIYDELHEVGADALQTAQDLLEICHSVTRIKLAGSTGAYLVDSSEKQRLQALGSGLSIPVLMRSWQLLLKAIAEIQQASDSKAALEMIIIRLGFMPDLPLPADLLKKAIVDSKNLPARGGATSSGGGGGATSARQGNTVMKLAYANSTPQASEAAELEAIAIPQNFNELVALAEARRDFNLMMELRKNCLVDSFAEGRIELTVIESPSPKFANHLSSQLSKWTRRAWVISLNQGAAGDRQTIAQFEQKQKSEELEWARSHALTSAFLKLFPDAEIKVLPITDPSLPPAPLTPSAAGDSADDSDFNPYRDMVPDSFSPPEDD
ncbi:MAG: DNA polymerase III subunit gamma/tau [Candidatus Pacebacteria bacterium]|nr:DNA polymerase III subunit gamma/tau [Candidatus Paceibacterota bacterium]